MESWPTVRGGYTLKQRQGKNKKIGLQNHDRSAYREGGVLDGHNLLFRIGGWPLPMHCGKVFRQKHHWVRWDIFQIYHTFYVSLSEGNVNLVPKATEYFFFSLSDKAEYWNLIWLIANLYCKIQISSGICGQGARVRAYIVFWRYW